MKRISALLIFLFFAGFGSTASNLHAEQVPSSIKSTDANTDEGWLLFSQGLLHENAYESSKDSTGREESLNKAIEFMEKSLAKSPDEAHPRIHAHLADCWFYKGDYSKAVDYGHKAVAGDPLYQPPYNRLYVTYLKLQNYPKAAGILEQYLKVNPDAVHFQLALGDLYMKNLNDNEKAEKIFLSALETCDRVSADDYYREQANVSLGYLSFRKNEVEKSIRYFEKAYGYNRNNDTVIYMLAHMNMYMYNIKAADTYALLFNSITTGNTSILSILGRIRYMRGDISCLGYLRDGSTARTGDGLISAALLLEMTGDQGEAETALMSILKWKPDCIEARMALASVLDKKGQAKEASSEYVNAGILAVNRNQYTVAGPLFRRAQELGDTRVELHYYLGRIEEEQGHYAGAVYHYGKLEPEKKDVELILHIGYLHGLRMDYKRAFAMFDKAIEIDPDNHRTWFFRGLGCMWTRDYPEAERYISQSVSKGGREENIFFYLAVVQEKQKKVKEAMSSLEQALQVDPDSARSMNYLGYLLADNSIRLDDSLHLITRALEIEPDNGAYLDSLGWVYYRKGEFNRALDPLLKAEKKLDETGMPDPVVYEHIGDTYIHLGDTDQAVRYWRKSLKMDDNGAVREKIRSSGADPSSE